MTPRFPPAGPDGLGSPPSQVLSRRYDFLLRLAFGLLIRPPAPRVPAGFVSVQNAPVGAQARRQAGGLIVRAGHPRSSGLAHGQEQDLPGSLAIHPVTLRRSTTPDDPSRLTDSGASGAAPTRLTVKASSINGFRGFLRRFITHCLRFTTPVTVRHARLVSGWRAAPLPGGSRTRWIAMKGFRSFHHSPFQGLPWRNNRSVIGGWRHRASGNLA